MGTVLTDHVMSNCLLRIISNDRMQFFLFTFFIVKLGSKWEQSGFKLGSKWVQIGKKLGSNWVKIELTWN